MMRSFFLGTHQSAAVRPATPVSRAEAVCIVLLAVAAAATLWWRWVGYQGTDDAYYAAAAMAWVNGFPALGIDHWSLRYPVVLPTAALLVVLGRSVFSLAAANLLYFLALMIVMYAGCRRFLGWPVAVLAAGSLVLLPAVVVQGTYANPDLPEALFAIGSFWCFLAAASRGGCVRWLLLAGGLAGLGFLTREISVAVVLFYGVLFLVSPQMPRIRYLVLAAGFVAVVGVQMVDFAVRAGDPLYRFAISSKHDAPDRAAIARAAAGSGRVLDAEGVVSAGPVLTPVLAVMVSQKFGLLFWLAIPAAVLIAVWRRVPAGARRVGLLAGWFGLSWFLFVALNAALLYVVPRYLMAVGVAAAVPAAVALVALWQAGWRVLPALCVAGFAGSGVLLLYLENTDPLHAEHLLVQVAARASEPVYADPRTAGRASLLLELRGLSVRSTPPPAGALVAINPRAAALCRESRYCGARPQMAPYDVAPGWVEVERMDAPTRLIGAVIRASTLDRRVPPDVMRKIEAPNDGLVVYRLPAANP